MLSACRDARGLRCSAACRWNSPKRYEPQEIFLVRLQEMLLRSQPFFADPPRSSRRQAAGIAGSDWTIEHGQAVRHRQDDALPTRPRPLPRRKSSTAVRTPLHGPRRPGGQSRSGPARARPPSIRSSPSSGNAERFRPRLPRVRRHGRGKVVHVPPAPGPTDIVHKDEGAG